MTLWQSLKVIEFNLKKLKYCLLRVGDDSDCTQKMYHSHDFSTGDLEHVQQLSRQAYLATVERDGKGRRDK